MISLQTQLLIRVSGDSLAEICVMRTPFRSIRLAAATQPSRLWRDVRPLLNFQVMEFVNKY